MGKKRFERIASLCSRLVLTTMTVSACEGDNGVGGGGLPPDR